MTNPKTSYCFCFCFLGVVAQTSRVFKRSRASILLSSCFAAHRFASSSDTRGWALDRATQAAATGSGFKSFVLPLCLNFELFDNLAAAKDENKEEAEKSLSENDGVVSKLEGLVTVSESI